MLGATGLIGRALVRELSKAGQQVQGTHHSHPGAGTLPFSLEEPISEALLAVVKRADVAVFCCGLSNLCYCANNPGRAWDVNVTATITSIEQVIRAGTRVIFLSSDQVFDGLKGQYSETDPTGPLTVYGRCKVAVEEHLLNNFRDRVAVVRLAKVLAREEDGPSLLSDWFHKFKAGSTIAATVDQRFCATPLDDIVMGLLRLMNGGASGIYHLCNPQSFSRHELLRMFAETMGFDPRLIKPCLAADLGLPDVYAYDLSMDPRNALVENFAHFTAVAEFLKTFRAPGLRSDR